jgi:preprotein translocase subunit SecA
MSMEEDVLGPEDEVLRDLFANDESDAAQQVQQQWQDKQAFVRTASTRTVGTKPAGVSRIGGVALTKSNDVDRLSGLWNSAPDVSEAFGMKR